MQSSVGNAWNYLEERFGVEQEDLEGFALREVAGDIWLVSEDMETALDALTYGFRFIRIQDIGLKPTTYALQFLNDRIEKNVVSLTDNQLESILAGELVPVTPDAEEGYVALKYEGRILGCGLYKNETVSSRIPKGRGNELADALF